MIEPNTLLEAIEFVKSYYPTAKCIAETKNPYATHVIIDERNVQISWLSGKVSNEEEAWLSAKDAIIGRRKNTI